jgi:hypothetical protein
MSKGTRYLGLDVHGETIAAAPGGRPARSLGQFTSRSQSVRKLIEKLGGKRPASDVLRN